MLKLILHALATLSLIAGANAAGAGISVQFVHPERFTDAGPVSRYQKPGENRALLEIRGVLLELGAKCLKSDQTLDILIRDVDLAGDDEWWHRRDGAELRVLRGIAAPRIKLEYVWRASDGRILAQGLDNLSGSGFLDRGTEMLARNEPLVYEKRMLREWFARNFCAVER